jgi:hypothetical protein
MRALFVTVALAGAACGSAPPIPTRGVVETDLGSWKFRRFQGPLLDIEVWVEGNKAEAYSASYITAEAEQRGHIEDKDLVNVFVTRYETPEGVVRATVKLARRLAADGGYQVEEDKIAGARTLAITGRGEAWVMWPSKQHVVKVGGRGLRGVPESMVANYVERYPSQLPGGALEGTLPPGPDGTPAGKPAKQEYDANDPHPDIEHYDPGKVKLPDKDAPRAQDPSVTRDAADASSAQTDGGDVPAGDAAKPAKSKASDVPATKKKRKPKSPK